MYKTYDNLQDLELIKLIKNGKIGVLPTDTLYGIVCSALNPKSVMELYQLRSRDPDKPVIILIDSLAKVLEFGVELSEVDRSFLESIVPASFTFLLKHNNNFRFDYLYAKSQYLSFRVPKTFELREFLRLSGPIVAPSCNLQGLAPAKNIKEAQQYFGKIKQVEFYVDYGTLDNPASTIGIIENGKAQIIRQGDYKIANH